MFITVGTYHKAEDGRCQHRLTVAAAIAELRSLCGESQQKFSNRLDVALATVGRWEIGDRHPSPRYLKELWHLAAEHNRADLAQPFADAFALSAGYALSSGESGFAYARRSPRFAGKPPVSCSVVFRRRIAPITSWRCATYSATRSPRSISSHPSGRSSKTKGKNQ
jgi:DNA-binding transcriptional regulator YiaG